MGKITNLLKSTDDFQNNEKLILRDHLALARTRLANERTLFSYVRTSLYLLTAGIGILEIKSIEHLKIIACISLFFSAFLFLIGLLKFYQLNRQLKSYLPRDTPTPAAAGGAPPEESGKRNENRPVQNR